MPFTPTNWQNLPSHATKINAAGLNHLGAQYQAVVDDIDDPATPVGGALSATISSGVAAGAGAEVKGRLSPLSKIEKSKTGAFRAYIMGTSISNFDAGIPRVFAERLRALYGPSRWSFIQFGGIGGSYDANYSGWKKQHYGGNIYTRIRGEASSTVFTQEFYGDFARFEFSRETDSEAVTILVDGVSIGSTPAAGAQLYRQALTYTGTEGYHTATFNIPAGAGYVYAETMESGVSTRTGVEFIDSTLGGSGIQHAINAWPKTAGQSLNPIAISGNNGLDYHFARTDIDLYIVEHDMNDGTFSLWQQGIDYVVAKTKLLGVPLVLIGEPHNDMATNAVSGQKRNYLLTLATSHGHVTVIDWHPMLAADGDVTTMNTLYYGGALGPSYPHPTTGYSAGVDALCKAAGITPPAAGDYTGSAQRRRSTHRAMATAEQVGKSATVSAVPKVLGAPEARVIQGVTLTQASGVWQYRGDHVYRTDIARGFANAASTIAAAGTSDEFGSYVTATATQNLGVTLGAGDVGLTMRFTILVNAASNGFVTFSTTSGVLSIEDGLGNTLPVNFGSGRQVVIRDAPAIGEQPAAYTFIMRGASTTSTAITLRDGRYYGTVLAASDVPVLPYAAGLTPPVSRGNDVNSPQRINGWYTSSIVNNTRTSALVLSRLYLAPCYTDKAITISQLSVNVNTAVASSVMRVGIYMPVFTTGSPLAAASWTLLVEAPATLDTSTTTGVKTVTLTTPIVMPAESWFFIAGVSQGVASNLFIGGSDGGFTPLGLSGTGYGSSAALSVYIDSVTGALPGTVSGTSATNVDAGVAYLRSA